MASLMFLLSMTLFFAGGVFYSSASSAGHGDALSREICTAGSTLCDHPGLLIAAGAIALCFSVVARLVASDGC